MKYKKSELDLFLQERIRENKEELSDDSAVSVPRVAL